MDFIKTTEKDYIDNLKFSGSTANEVFYGYEMYLKEKAKEMKALTDEYKEKTEEVDKKKKPPSTESGFLH
mgnify:CR=1 FL=1